MRTLLCFLLLPVACQPLLPTAHTIAVARPSHLAIHGAQKQEGAPLEGEPGSTERALTTDRSPTVERAPPGDGPLCVGASPLPRPRARPTCCYPEKQGLLQAFRSRYPDFSRCHAGEGRVVVAVDVAPSGRTVRACEVASDLPEPVVRCVLEASRGIRFDESRSCPPIRVVYPIVFARR